MRPGLAGAASRLELFIVPGAWKPAGQEGALHLARFAFVLYIYCFENSRYGTGLYGTGLQVRVVGAVRLLQA